MIEVPLAMISFAAPWMVWAAAAVVGLPLLAHLLSRTKYREVVFPAARWVQQAIAQTSRIETPRHRLLMLLRALVLALLVLAFMRPQWTPSAEAGSTERGITLIVMVDRSASMQRIVDGVSLYDRAKRDADQLLDQLDPSRDTAAVVVVDHAPRSLLPIATAQFDQLSDQLEATQPGYTTANWPAAIAQAARLTQQESRTVRIVTLSDQQGDQPDMQALAGDRPGIAVDHIRFAGSPDNTAVRLVDVRPYPVIHDRPFTVTFEVQHYGDEPRQVVLTASSMEQEYERSLTIGPGETRRVQIDFVGNDWRKRSGEPNRDQFINASIDSFDGLPDDQVGMNVPIRSSSRAYVIHDLGPIAKRLANRVALLINPDPTSDAALPEVETLPVNQVETVIEQLDLAEVRTIVLINQQPLNDATSQALEAFAQRGGGVIQFVSDGTVDRAQTTTAAAIDFELDPLRIFQGPARAGLTVLAWPGVSNAGIDPRATPILMDEMERVIVAEMPRGRGRLIAINAALGAEPGGLLAQPGFVVLFNELCRYASPGPALPPPIHPGEPIPADLREAVRAQGPYGWPFGFDPDSDVYSAVGPYVPRPADERFSDINPVFVTLDPTESDTRPTLPWVGITATSDQAAATQSSNVLSGPLRQDPIEFWPVLLLLCLGLVAGESLLLWRYARPVAPTLQGGAV